MTIEAPIKTQSILIATSFRDRAVPNHFRALAKRLVERGHRVAIVFDGQPQMAPDPENNPAIFFWPSRRPTHAADAIFLHALLKTRRVDTVVANFGAITLVTLIAAAMRVRNRIIWYRTLSSQIEKDWTGPKWKLRLLRVRRRLVISFTTHVVANSEFSRTDFHEVFIRRHRSIVFPNNLPDPVGDVVPGIYDFEARRQAPKFVCAGRFSPSKGQDTVIRAAARLDNHFLFEFAGDGPQLSVCKQLARDLGVEDRCSFLGALPHEEVISRMALALATIVPSRQEAFGWVNIESLAVGTPVLATRVGGIPEIIEPGLNGFLFDVDDYSELSKLILRIGADQGVWNKMHLDARSSFLTKFEEGVVLEEEVNFLERLNCSAHSSMTSIDPRS